MGWKTRTVVVATWALNGCAWGALVWYLTDLASGIECAVGLTLVGLCAWALLRGAR